MALWAAHSFADQEEWAGGLVERAEHDCEALFERNYFEGNRKERLAFRDFGTALDIKCGRRGFSEQGRSGRKRVGKLRGLSRSRRV